MDDTGMRRRHRVAIVGAGFGGLFAAKWLRHAADVDVTVIDRTNHHLFQPLLYQLATGILSEGDIAPPIRDVLRHQQNTTVVLGEVIAVDLDARSLTVETVGRRSRIPYDSLIVATGASQSYFGHPEFAHEAPGMKTIDHALELRGRIFGAFEMAEREPDPAARRRWLTFVVVGAGPTGVEVAGQLAELSRRSLRRNFRQHRSSRGAGGPARRRPDHPAFVSRVAASARSPRPPRRGRRDPCRHNGHRRRRARGRDELGESTAAADRSGGEDLGSRSAGLAARPSAGRSGRRRASIGRAV